MKNDIEIDKSVKNEKKETVNVIRRSKRKAASEATKAIFRAFCDDDDDDDAQ